MFKQPSITANQHQFSQIPHADIPRSSFNRSHGVKTAFDAGYLIPFYIDEVVPGDTFNLRATTFARLATPIVPIMDNIYLDTFFFAVPYRLVWDNFQKFMGEQINPGDSIDFLIPQMSAPAVTGYQTGTLSDYMGIPVGRQLTHSSLWHRAYNLIWNQFFRDENLQNSVTVDKGDGPDNPSNYVLKRRGKRHDYFTSCLPWPQKGTAVSVPLGSTAPVTRVSNATFAKVYRAGTNTLESTSDNLRNDSVGKVYNSGTSQYLSIDPNGGLVADLSSATAATINSLRQAFQLQKMFERDARGGTRYTEIIKSHFNVTSPDARLQRPEYLGGGSTPVNIHPIAQTSESNTTPKGDLSAFGTASHSGVGFTKSFTEHCLLIGLVSARADLNYMQGLNKMFSKRTRSEMYWPSFSHLGEQSVLMKEIYVSGVTNDDNAVWGYQERYAEMRYKPSIITGILNSAATTTPVDQWHLAQHFTSAPALNSTFIEENPPMSRVLAVNTEPHFIMDAFINLKCARPMPTYSVPGLIDHF